MDPNQQQPIQAETSLQKAVREAPDSKSKFKLIILIIILLLTVGGGSYSFGVNQNRLVQNQKVIPATCEDKQEGAPVITSLSSYSGSIGAKIEIMGCNFSGFEGDKNAWIENGQGVKGILRGEEGSTSKILEVILKSPLCQKDNSFSGLPCDAWLTLNPGTYKIYTSAWEKKSNEVNFTIK